MKRFATMEDSHELKRKHTKRKAVKEESMISTEELPSKLPQNKVRVSDEGLSKHPDHEKFMKIQDIFEFLQTTTKVYDDIPSGEKKNVFFVVKDSENAERREKDLPVKYIDGCLEVSNKGNNGAVYFQFIAGKATPLRFKNNLFYMSEYNKTQTYTLLKPQPDPKSIIKVCRYYAVLKGNIKRRITSVSGIRFKDRTMFEYCSFSRGPKDHCDNTTLFEIDRRIIRRSVKVEPKNELHVCDEETKQTAPKKRTRAKNSKPLNSKMLKKDKDESRATVESNEEVLDIKQEYPKDIKHSPNSVISLQREVSSEVSDKDLIMIAMLEENLSVQAVINRKNKPPCAILYNDKQFSDMKRNLDCGSILGLDCSYKFGACYCTMTVYQNSRALHQETNEPLLYLGPVFLHWDQEFLTYMSFFTHIMDKLDNIEPDFEVKLGDDFQLSLFKALKHSFPTSVQLVNSHKLKDLVDKHLFNVTDGRLSTRAAILHKIFGPHGIVSSPSISALENRVMELECFFEEFPNLKTYFDKLQVFLYSHICEPQQKGISPKLWANGNDELLNDLLCTYLKRKPQKLHDIAEKMCAIFSMQMLKLDIV